MVFCARSIKPLEGSRPLLRRTRASDRPCRGGRFYFLNSSVPTGTAQETKQLLRAVYPVHKGRNDSQDA
jgi:hypothetical protein